MKEKELVSMLSMLETENSILKQKVSGICKVYRALRPVLKFVRIFSFIKKGGRVAIDAAMAVMDEVCPADQQP